MPRRPHARTADSTAVAISTIDDIALTGISLPGPSSGTKEFAYVICHGMTNATSTPFTRVVLDAFAVHAPVVAFDFRGHGRSAGRSSVGRDEVLDVDAAIRFAREDGHDQVALIGFSMGGAVALRHAGAVGRDPQLTHPADVVVSVSAPSRWFLRESTSMRRVQRLLEHPLGGIVGPRLGIRLSAPWVDVPTTPLEEVGYIAPTPLLIVHGTADHYFGIEQAQALHRSAPGSELWIIDRMRHAESGISTATIDRIADWVAARL